MRRAAKFVSLPWRDQWLLLSALGTVCAIRFRLAVLPFRGGRGYCRRVSDSGPSATPERIAWAVDRAGQFLGKTTCLPRALAGHAMLARRGFASSIHIGVDTGNSGQPRSPLLAHAWLERHGRILLGGPDVGHYKLLVTWCNQ